MEDQLTGFPAEDCLAKPLSFEASEDQIFAAEGRWLSNIPILAELLPSQEKKPLIRHNKLMICGLHLRLMRMGSRPTDIPSNPQKTYADKGWSGMPNWLGTGRTRVSKSPKRKT